MRQNGLVQKAAVLIAVGVDEAGKRTVRGVSVALSEHELHQRTFLQSLVSRGLCGVRLVIIDRIPFAVPDSPLNKARVDSITATGGDWFNDFALPQAQLKLKQGFGRLICTSTDRGVVAILDTRIVRKTYGERFLRFLPPARRVFDIGQVQAFFAEKL